MYCLCLHPQSVHRFFLYADDVALLASLHCVIQHTLGCLQLSVKQFGNV